ncbi:MAG: Uncharacterized MFS-type transporter, partial [uncultured Blastococcus sp.]
DHRSPSRTRPPAARGRAAVGRRPARRGTARRPGRTAAVGRARAHQHGAAHGGARRHGGEHRAAPDPDRPEHRRRRPHLDGDRLRDRLRRAAAARRPARRHHRPPQGVPRRRAAVLRRFPAGRDRPGAVAAARCAGPAGCRRGGGLAHRAGADHHHVPGRPAAQPGVRRLRGDVRRRSRCRPHPRRRAHRGVVALDDAHQRAHRARRGVPGAALPRGVRSAARALGPARGPDRDDRAHLDRLRLQPQGAGRRGHRTAPGVVGHPGRGPAGRRRPAGRRLLRHRGTQPARAPAVARDRRPDQGGELRGDAGDRSRALRDVPVPVAVRPAGARLQPAGVRRGVPAVHGGHHRRGPGRLRAGVPGRPPLDRRRGRCPVGAGHVGLQPTGGGRLVRGGPAAVDRPAVGRDGAAVRPAHPHGGQPGGPQRRGRGLGRPQHGAAGGWRGRHRRPRHRLRQRHQRAPRPARRRRSARPGVRPGGAGLRHVAGVHGRHLDDGRRHRRDPRGPVHQAPGPGHRRHAGGRARSGSAAPDRATDHRRRLPHQGRGRRRPGV